MSWPFKKKLRVLTLGSVPPEWGGVSGGGVSVVHRQIVEALGGTSYGREINLIGTVPTNLAPMASGFAHIPQFFRPPLDKRQERDWYLALLQSVKPDCVLFFHVAHRWSKYHLCSSIPMAGAIHSWTPITQVDEKRSELNRSLVSQVLRECGSVIIPSHHTVAEGHELGFHYSSDPFVVHNALSSTFCKPLNSSFYQREANKIISIGGLKSIKRFDLSIKAACKLNMKLLLIGDGPESNHLKSLVSQLGFDNYFEHVRSVEHDDVADHLLSAGVYCGASQSESFGNVYIEVLACGVPVVGFQPTLNEIGDRLGIQVGRGVGPDAGEEEVISAIQEVVSMNIDREALARITRSTFSVANMCEGYVNAIKQAVSSRRL